MNYLIYGFAGSGEGALSLLRKNKKNVIYIFDCDKNVSLDAFNKTKIMPRVFVLNELTKEIIMMIDKVILSPGVSIYDKWVKLAKKLKKEVLSELEFGFRNCNKKIIAITGTNGKTTCTKLLNDILNASNKKSVAVGNVGYPITKAISNEKNKKIFVCEVSSFQLEAIKDFKPNIACILNVTPDHINRHKSFYNYKRAKYRILKNLTKKESLIVNENLNIKNEKTKVFEFSTKKCVEGCFLKDGNIFFRKNGKEKFVCMESEILLPGKHNLENVLAVLTVCKILKIKNKYITKILKNFKLDDHRIQRIFEKNGVDFIDDSKATNVDATINAINSFDKPMIVLLGGSDKGYDFDEIFIKANKNVKKFVCFGQVGRKIKEQAKKYNYNCEYFKSLKEATAFCCKIATQGDLVLLSPANASFDEFKGYDDRGNKFLEYIKESF